MEGLGCSLLDNRTVSHRIGKGDAYFYHMDAFGFQLFQNGYRIVQLRVTGCKINGQDAVLFCFE